MKNNSIITQQDWKVSIAWWCFWWVVLMLGLHRVGEGWADSMLQAIITVGFLAFVEFIIDKTYSYYRPASSSLFFQIGYILILTAGTGRGMLLVFRLIYGSESEHYVQIEKYMPMRGMFVILMVTFMVMFYWFKNRTQEQSEIKQRQEDAERLLREAELSRLRQQLQPHFLFNSLNSISALVGSRPEQARHMVQQLSDFLRGTLRKDEQALVTLEEEFRHLQLYLEIEKVRFGHRLNTVIQCDEESKKMKLPSLLIQPVMENAVKFGLYDTTDAITIELMATNHKDQLLIEVRNPFDPTSAAAKGTGFGLTSVKRRLYLLYARHDLLETKAEEDTFMTILKIPQHND